MVDGLSKQSISSVYKNMDLKEYLETAIDSSYSGLAMFRPAVEGVTDRTYQDMFAGGTIVKFSHFDGEYPIFDVITTSARYVSDRVFIPFPLLQKMSAENFRPWPEGALVRDNQTNHWLLICRYTDKAEVVTQELRTGKMAIHKLENITHAKAYSRFGGASYQEKGSDGVKLNKEQAEKAGLPVGTIAPFVKFHSNPGGEVLVEALQIEELIPYSEVEFTNSASFYFRKLVACIEDPRFHEENF